MDLLTEKVAVITGAAGNLGQAIVEKFCAEGAKAAVIDLNPASLKALAARMKKDGREILDVPSDVISMEECETAFRKVFERFGRLDILVNAAGIRTDIPFGELAEAEWGKVIEVNLSGCFNATSCAQKYMVKNGYGKIVNIASDLSSIFNDRHSHYIAASYGVQGLTKAVALELGPYNINVNCVVPDFIHSEMTRKTARAHGMYLDELRATAASLVPLRRLGTPDDVANLVLFLASDMSGFITGQIVFIKGAP